MNEKYIGDRITQLRITSGVSEQKMSYELGMSKTYIWNIVEHQSLPSMKSFFEICEYLNVSPAEFFEETLTKENIEIIKSIGRLDENDKEFVMRIIQTLLKE